MGGQAEIWTCPECGATLDISEVGFYKEVACPACGHAEVVHTRLANFRLTGVLGIGGMSVVFKANDLILNRPLAIKVLNDTYKDQPERIARFENECAMMARVRHDNVVSVYSAGRARGQFYIAMELVRGRDMEHTIRHSAPLSPSAALEVTREVALGLQAAAQAGLLHRDMKPGNILISQTDGRAKVLDFGLSLGAQTEDTEEVIWATPFYVAPETLRREQEDVRTDIYALGMTLRFLLTGVDQLPRPFSSIADLLAAKKHLPSFSTAGVSAATPSFIDLVDHMTAFDPVDRPPSYQDLLQELDETLAVQNLEESVNAPERMAKKKCIRQICIAATVVAGLAGAAVTAFSSQPPPKQDSLPVEPFTAWGDLALFEEGLSAVAQEDWESADDAFEAINEHAGDPALAAFCSLLRYYMALTDDDRLHMSDYLEDFHRHMEREEKPASSAAAMYGQMKQLDAFFFGGKEDAAVDGVTNPVLCAILNASQVEADSAFGYVAGKACIDRSRDEWRKAGGSLAKFASCLDNLTGQLNRFCKSGNFVNLHKALLAHDFVKCDACFASLQAMPSLSSAEKDRLAVLKEIRSVAEVMVGVLKKRFPQEYYPGMQPAVMRDLAAKLNQEGLEQEIFSLGLLMKGDYAAAFRYNPYWNDEKSTKPFAVLMRHWEKQLNY